MEENLRGIIGRRRMQRREKEESPTLEELIETALLALKYHFQDPRWGIRFGPRRSTRRVISECETWTPRGPHFRILAS